MLSEHFNLKYPTYSRVLTKVLISITYVMNLTSCGMVRVPQVENPIFDTPTNPPINVERTPSPSGIDESETENTAFSTQSPSPERYVPLIAINYALHDSYPLDFCMEHSVNSKIQVITLDQEEYLDPLNNGKVGHYYPVWHPTDSKLAYIEVDFSSFSERNENSSIIRSFPGDQIVILDLESREASSVGSRIPRIEAFTPRRLECNTRYGMTMLDGWSPNGAWLAYRFYDVNLLGEQFAIVNVNLGDTTILGRNIGSFDWVEGEEEVIALNGTTRSFSVIDISSATQVRELPFPPTSGEDWLPLIEWNEITGTFISDAPSSNGNGTSFWLWNDQEDDWEEQTMIPGSHPVQTWDTHSSTTVVCNSGDQGAELLVMDTESLTLIDRYALPSDTICRTMDRSFDPEGREIVAFLQERSSIFIIAFNGDGDLTREIDLSEYIYQLDIPEFETTETYKPFWIDLYP
jgi:hypothetical protein